jgi:hypothetical protein
LLATDKQLTGLGPNNKNIQKKIAEILSEFYIAKIAANTYECIHMKQFNEHF